MSTENADRHPDVVLRADRLVLRRYRDCDVAAMHDIYGRPDVARFLLEDAWTQDEAVERVALRQQRTGLEAPTHALALVIEHGGPEGTVLGDVALWFTDPARRVGEIGWVLHPDAGGKGFAAEAVRAVLDLAFTGHGAHRIVAQMDGRNAASARLAARVGMRQEAHLRQNWWSKGEWTDTLVFAMLGSDRLHPHGDASPGRR